MQSICRLSSLYGSFLISILLSLYYIYLDQTAASIVYENHSIGSSIDIGSLSVETTSRIFRNCYGRKVDHAREQLQVPLVKR